MTVRVLIADRSSLTREIIRHHLECGGCDVIAETESGAQALDLFRTTRPDVVTLDLGLRGVDPADAIGLFRTIRRESPATSIVIVSAAREPDCHHLLLREGALDCIMEPFDTFGFERMWRRLSEIYPELRRNDQLPSGH